MSKSTSAIITLLLLLLIAYGAYDFYLNFEYKEKTIHTGFRGEARKNPYYASRLFLKRMGIPTETKNNLQGMGGFPDTDTVLIITTKRSTLSPERTQDLIDWVKSGGHLIALAISDWKRSDIDEDSLINDDSIDENWEDPDPLQRFMGVRKAYGYTFIEQEEKEEKEDKDEDESTTQDEQTAETITLSGTEKALQLDETQFRPLFVDDDHREQTEEIELGEHNYILRQKIGQGMVTLITDMSFFKNKYIDAYDHAEILWQLVHGLHQSLNQPKKIWLIHNDEMPPLWDILWRNFWALLISLTLLLGFWLFKISQRFGPVIPKEDENRRSLNEHITSSGYFYWKNNKKQTLIESSRKALTQRLTRVFPGWTHYNEEEQVKMLAEHLSIKPDTVHKLLYAKEIEQADDFTQLIKQLEEIRKTI